MAAKYGMLPSEIVERGNTIDVKFHIISESYKERERIKARGDKQAMADSFTQAEIDEAYNKWRSSK